VSYKQEASHLLLDLESWVLWGVTCLETTEKLNGTNDVNRGTAQPDLGVLSSK